MQDPIKEILNGELRLSTKLDGRKVQPRISLVIYFIVCGDRVFGQPQSLLKKYLCSFQNA